MNSTRPTSMPTCWQAVQSPFLSARAREISDCNAAHANIHASQCERCACCDPCSHAAEQADQNPDPKHDACLNRFCVSIRQSQTWTAPVPLAASMASPCCMSAVIIVEGVSIIHVFVVGGLARRNCMRDHVLGTDEQRGSRLQQLERLLSAGSQHVWDGARMFSCGDATHMLNKPSAAGFAVMDP